jgi:hypothetical protein
MIVFGAIFFGGALGAIVGPRVLPATDLEPLAKVIFAAALLLVGACFGEFLWQMRSRYPSLSRRKDSSAN